jgi:xanthine/uracil permease
MLRTVGAITTCQKINDLDWKRPELKSIQRGIVADGIGCVIGGVLGATGMSSGVAPVGVAQAAGATSPYIAFSCAAILVIVAFIPKYAALFLIMPQLVIGALIVFTASFMIAGGIQIILSRSIDTRATYVVGVSLLLGLAREIFPTYSSWARRCCTSLPAALCDWRHLGVSAQSDLPHRRGPQRNIRIRGLGNDGCGNRDALTSARQGMVGRLGRH